MAKQVYTAIGLMSGTSLDGVDAALIRTDGESVVETGPWVSMPYSPLLRAALRGLLGAERHDDSSRTVEQAITEQHAAAINVLLNENSISISEIDIIGFHGHTVTHRPERRFTWQLGDPESLASTLNCAVVADFRVPHRVQHFLGRARDGVAAQVDAVLHCRLLGVRARVGGGC